MKEIENKKVKIEELEKQVSAIDAYRKRDKEVTAVVLKRMEEKIMVLNEVNNGSLGLRPVVVTGGGWKGRKGFFHFWDTSAYPDSKKCLPYAIIEFDDGCGSIPLGWVQFTDRK